MSLRHGLLALLEDGPRHGYRLKTEFEAATGGLWTLNIGQVYTTLDRLQRDDLVTAVERTDGGEGHRAYELTAAGRETLGAWWHAASLADPPPRDELLLKVLLAVRAGPSHALAVITEQRTAIYELLQRQRREQRASMRAPRAGVDASQAARDALAEALAIDASIVRAEADIRWLDVCEERVLREGAG